MNNPQPMYDKDGLPIPQPTSQFQQPQNFGQFGQQNFGQFGQYGQGSPYGQPQMQQFTPAQPPQMQQMQMAYGHAVPQKNKFLAAALFFFLGSFGIGNFYLGQNFRGVVKVGFFLTGSLFSLIPFVGWIVSTPIFLALWVWCIIEMIMVLVGGGSYDTDANGIPLK
ncbi:NINE protein [Corynebacterium sp. NML130628]|uniref:NINE protein n=1 Tax=Corynebacterium sp. NML130628 TaxID=1906333 RepID=UPI0008FB8FA3|nr:NINE protein [Corynebacterium sp. NML130628]OIR45872.1 hypothetical protein BJP07_02260 [Corynebacterium sp. NML130628]